MKVETRPTAALRPHPLNAEIYGDTADDELVSRVQMLGIIHPLLITREDVVISGHRRLDAATRLGLETVPVLVSPLTDALDIEELLIEANRQRQPSNEQRVREYRHLKALRLQRVGVRGPRPVLYPAAPPAELTPDLAALDPGGFGPTPTAPTSAPSAPALRTHTPPPPPSADQPPPDEEGIDRRVAREARAEAARQVGGNPNTLERGARIVEHIDALEQAELRNEAEDLRQLLNRRSVAAAWRKITEPEAPLEPVDRPPLTRLRKVADETEQWLLRNLEDPRADKMQHAVDAVRAALELFEEEVEP